MWKRGSIPRHFWTLHLHERQGGPPIWVGLSVLNCELFGGRLRCRAVGPPHTQGQTDGRSTAGHLGGYVDFCWRRSVGSLLGRDVRGTLQAIKVTRELACTRGNKFFRVS